MSFKLVYSLDEEVSFYSFFWFENRNFSLLYSTNIFSQVTIEKNKQIEQGCII